MSNVVLVLIAFATLGAGCANNGDGRCNGNRVQHYYCDDGDGCSWVGNEACSGTCMAAGSNDAICALSTTPDARCKDQLHDAYCNGSTLVSCAYGYRVGTEECTDYCNARPDPFAAECGGERYLPALCDNLFATCDSDGKWVDCDIGYISESANCADGTFCTTYTGESGVGTASCTLQQTVDPECAGVDGFCDGNVLYRCHEGYRVYAEICADGATCSWSSSDDDGKCNGGTKSTIGTKNGDPS